MARLRTTTVCGLDARCSLVVVAVVVVSVCVFVCGVDAAGFPHDEHAPALHDDCDCGELLRT